MRAPCGRKGEEPEAGGAGDPSCDLARRPARWAAWPAVPPRGPGRTWGRAAVCPGLSPGPCRWAHGLRRTRCPGTTRRAQAAPTGLLRGQRAPRSWQFGSLEPLAQMAGLGFPFGKGPSRSSFLSVRAVVSKLDFCFEHELGGVGSAQDPRVPVGPSCPNADIYGVSLSPSALQCLPEPLGGESTLPPASPAGPVVSLIRGTPGTSCSPPSRRWSLSARVWRT